MPSSSRAESLVGIAEVIDGPHAIDATEEAMASTGFAIKARASALSTFPPLGPPDMLYVRKRYVPVVGPSKLYGYYHFVRGVEASHVASISAYIVDVVRNKGLDPQSWVSTGGWEIASATFTAYNVMAKADAVVHVDFPGSTTATAVDGEGTTIALSESFWAELVVSCVVRDHVGAGEQPLYPCLRVVSPFTAMRVEPLFLDAAAECARRWHLAGVDGLETTTEFASRSRIAYAIRDHFLSNARFDAAISFFSRDLVRQADADCVVHAAAAARKKGDLARATAIIDELIDLNAQSELAWMERANILRASGDLEKALEAAKTASTYATGNVDTWIVLADLNVDLRQYSKAFEALNSADMPPPSLDPFLRELVPNRKNLTSPVEGASQGLDAIRVLANRLREEKNMSNEKTDDTLSELPGKLMTKSEHNCYAVLVKILSDISWDEMLAVRSECFVMEADVENGHVVDSESEDSEGEEGGHEEQSAGIETAVDVSTANDVEEQAREDDQELANGLAQISIHGNSSEGDTNANGDIANGEDPLNESNGPSSAENSPSNARIRSLERIGKQVCKPWLDYLVTNMYQDLRAMAMWNAEEQQHSAAAALYAASLTRKSQGEVGDGESMSSPSVRDDVEGQESENDYRRTPDEVANTTKRPAADWLRRGELALRLGKMEEAKTAFWTCVKLSAKERAPAVTAYCRIMKISADDGDAKTAVKCADEVWSYIDRNTDRKHSSDPTPPVPEIRSAIFSLISRRGLRAVRDTVASKVEVDRKRMEGLLLDAVALQVDGFTR